MHICRTSCLRFLVGLALLLTTVGGLKAHSSIVYVHLGSALPSYLYDALKQARLFNEEASVCLIANQQALTSKARDFSSRYTITLVECESLRSTESHKLFARSTTLDNQWRGGFWRKATERFFYLHEYMVQHAVNHVCHLESDNMLYVDIADILSALKTYTGIGAVFDNDERCIPSFMYIADADAMTDFVQFIAQNAKKGMNDMDIISLYRKERSRYHIDYLPLIMGEYAKRYTLQSTRGDKPLESAVYYRNEDRFQSIFDGAAIGQYLGGIDPIHHNGSKPGFINEGCVFNPARFNFQWAFDAQGRKVPYAVLEGKRYRINNLHIHSKRLHEFRS